EEERRAVMYLQFSEPKSPFNIEAGSKNTFTFSVGLSKGNMACNNRVAIWLPKGFEFMGEVTPLPSVVFPDHVSAYVELPEIVGSLAHEINFEYKAPSTPGSYTGKYKLYCDQSVSDFVSFDINVKKTDKAKSSA
ncbi:hypothetical protein ACFLW1_03490, partial [Chloroflexota bacterium]